MTFSQVSQPGATYMTWTWFSFPTPAGSINAIAVPATFRNEINSIYTLLARSAVVNVWIAILVCGMYFRLHARMRNNRTPDISDASCIMMSVWNNKVSPKESLLRLLHSATGEHRQEWWFYPLGFALLAAWVANIVAGIVIPGGLFIGNGAPVNPSSIYVPSVDTELSDSSNLIKALVLDAPSSLRAVGSVLMSEEMLGEKVLVGQPVPRGKTEDGQPVQQISYSFTVSGADLGLQHYPQLTLNATGACITDYSWHLETRNITVDGRPAHQDIYQTISGNVSASIYDGRAPSATFLAWDVHLMNVSWAAIVSSVDRGSSAPSSDPWYLTGPNPQYNRSDPSAAPYMVLPARPVLLCWQNDQWSYLGRTSDISRLSSEALPGLHLSDGLQKVLLHYLRAPRIYNLGNDLGMSTLQSAALMAGSFFNADDSSIRTDLRRLVYAAYIATVNTLTDTTLHTPADPRKASVPNMVLDELGRVLPGVADFVVYTNNVVTISLLHAIAIPCGALGSWLLTLLLLNTTALKVVKTMDIAVLFSGLKEEFPNAGIALDGRSGKWVFTPIQSTA
ncbi:hypothetical protein B0T25DRAFT_599099 [Lasiosphaeria hispida]|uniref:Uncharacterized protein n=1 Tax=Lasiosphaeria hispida TaxID=260671 RepID=A0AAJ0HXX5_9PEZI|nr:hypothetical protein B0T25DRAFT_599099 [Lasiosphaeria hispida]